MSEDKLKECPKCKELKLEKIITAGANFQLKGNGWFNKGGY
jgi:putative FmdB family regulatory protein